MMVEFFSVVGVNWAVTEEAFTLTKGATVMLPVERAQEIFAPVKLNAFVPASTPICPEGGAADSEATEPVNRARGSDAWEVTDELPSPVALAGNAVRSASGRPR